MHRPARDPRQTESASSAGERQATRVCAYALCRRDDELLLVRASAQTDVEGTWFLPGGGLAYGEAPE